MPRYVPLADCKVEFVRLHGDENGRWNCDYHEADGVIIRLPDGIVKEGGTFHTVMFDTRPPEVLPDYPGWSRTGDGPHNMTVRPSVIRRISPVVHFWITDGTIELLDDTEWFVDESGA